MATAPDTPGRAERIAARAGRAAGAVTAERVGGWGLAGSVAAVAAMSLSGLVAFGTSEMGWEFWRALILPASLDAAAVAVTGFAFGRIAKGESAAQFRLIAAALVGTSAYVNWRGQLPSGNPAREWVFPFMSVMVYWIAHALMGARRRDERRGQHGQAKKRRAEPLPRFGAWEWLFFPLSTMGALREAVRARGERSRSHLASQPRSRPASQPPPSVRPAVSSHGSPAASHGSPGENSRGSGSVIAAKSQSAAIRIAIGEVGADAGRVVEYLAGHGWPGVAKQRVWTLLGRDAKDARQLRVVGEEQAGA